MHHCDIMPKSGRVNEKVTTKEVNENEDIDKIVEMIIPILKNLIWAKSTLREKIQKYGINILPIDYYSNTPSIEEIKNSYEYTEDVPPYQNNTIFNSHSLEIVLDELTAFSGEFNPPREGDENMCTQFFWDNNMFSYCDAMAYYCLIRKVQPRTVIEIGGGFSTLAAKEALKENKKGAIHCIDPHPRPFLKSDDIITLNVQKAQDIKADFLNNILHDDDILFLDSTHTVKTGSDSVHIFLRLLPNIKRDIYVHVHDVYLPYGLPINWLLELQRFWTEQYLLMAFLLDNQKAAVLYGSNFNAKMFPRKMEKFMEGKYKFGGNSLWFKYNNSK